jgi:hypothetical protein
MSKKTDDSLENYMMLAEILLRVTALEKTLLNKGIFTKEEYSKVVEEVSSEAAKNILQKALNSGEINKMIESDSQEKFNKN